VPDARLSRIEFPADDPERARRFWEGLLVQPSVASSITSERRTMSTASANIANWSA
jgi:hypothetical protein